MDPSIEKGATFQLHHFMSHKRLDYMLSDLKFINKKVPYEDGFLHMQQLEEYQNQNIADQFSHHASISLMSPL